MIYLDLFIGFLQVGLFAFGGAYGAIPLIRDVVLSYGWIEDEMLAYMIAVSESTPGPIMVNLATYVGSAQAGFLGALIATIAVVLPSFVIILLVMALLKRALKNPWVQAVLRGVKPCIVGIILATGLFFVFRNCFGSVEAPAANGMAILLTAALALIYFGSRKVLKKGLSPHRAYRALRFGGYAGIWISLKKICNRARSPVLCFVDRSFYMVQCISQEAQEGASGNWAGS